MVLIRMPIALLLGLFLACVPASPALAWWGYGHRTIARIAQDNVAPHTRAAIARLLADQALLKTPTCPAHDLTQAAVWADCVKTLGERFRYQSDWHFQNIELCQPFDLKSACRGGNCVSAQIEREVTLLEDKQASERAKVKALVLLTHFVGDLHQPLHSADHHDAGGNDVAMTYGGVPNARLNLHMVWDGYLAQRAIATAPSLVHRYSTVQRRTMAAGTVRDWSHQSWEIARKYAYPTALGANFCTASWARDRSGHLSNAQIKTLVPIVRLQIVRAGLRLARLLDTALASD